MRTRHATRRSTLKTGIAVVIGFAILMSSGCTGILKVFETADVGTVRSLGRSHETAATQTASVENVDCW